MHHSYGIRKPRHAINPTAGGFNNVLDERMAWESQWVRAPIRSKKTTAAPH
jgi:hypothetical protein